MPTQAPIIIGIHNNLRITGLASEFRETLMERLTFPNPKYLENARLGRYNWKTPKELKFYDKVGKDGLWIPRGYIRQLVNLCKRNGLPFKLDDQRRTLPPVDFSFKGELKPFQQTAVRVMMPSPEQRRWIMPMCRSTI